MPWKFWNRKKEIDLGGHGPAEEEPLRVKAAPDANNPCLRCGACCAFFLVSFPPNEADPGFGGLVPLELTGESADLRRYMRGTETKKPRCIALNGFVGTRVNCRIYLDRPSTCRAFCRSWEHDVGNHLCDRARAAYGMQVFSQY